LAAGKKKCVGARGLGILQTRQSLARWVNSEANPFMVYHRYRMKVRKKWIIAEVKLYLDEGKTNVNETVPTDETLGKYGMNRGNFEP